MTERRFDAPSKPLDIDDGDLTVVALGSIWHHGKATELMNADANIDSVSGICLDWIKQKSVISIDDHYFWTSAGALGEIDRSVTV
jgi:hypothetical protein